MYVSGTEYTRTPEERADPFLSWKRDDKAFFASGACHILSFFFTILYPDNGYEIIFIKPKNRLPGSHVYVKSGDWAFDFNGWSKEAELLNVTEGAYGKQYPGWGYEKIVVKDDLETFCKQNYHRPPAYFAYLPWERTYKFIRQFSSNPPKS